MKSGVKQGTAKRQKFWEVSIFTNYEMTSQSSVILSNTKSSVFQMDAVTLRPDILQFHCQSFSMVLYQFKGPLNDKKHLKYITKINNFTALTSVQTAILIFLPCQQSELQSITGHILVKYW